LKIAIIANDTFTLVKFRMDMLKSFLDKGHQIVVLVPDHEYFDELKALSNVRCIELCYNRTGTNPISDLHLLKLYSKKLKEEKPDVVFSYNLKPVIYGIYAAYKAGINYLFAMIPGAGFVFSGETTKARLIRMVIRGIYRKSLSYCNKVFFQNPDDLREFVEKKLISREKCVQVYGSGINLEQFQPVPFPGKLVFLFCARLLKVKGILEYCAAAQSIRRKYPQIEFHVVGGYDENPTCIAKDELEQYISCGDILYHGKVNDVRPYIKMASVFVLPSYHREGVPHAALEAMAMGRPVLTTNAIGCRETVKDGINGFMVPPKDTDALEQKMLWFIENSERIGPMGAESRRYCAEKFDVKRVNHIILNTMSL
jgi:glycosyltransferase involved in cell wall biosynthesis